MSVRRKGKPNQPTQNVIRQALDRAQATDRARQMQIANQSASITRLLRAMHNPDVTGSEAAAAEIGTLTATLAGTQYKLEQALGQIKLLEATALEGMEQDMGKKKDAFYAGFEAGETEDSVDESWAEYKASLDEPAAGEDASSDDE